MTATVVTELLMKTLKIVSYLLVAKLPEGRAPHKSTRRLRIPSPCPQEIQIARYICTQPFLHVYMSHEKVGIAYTSTVTYCPIHTTKQTEVNWSGPYCRICIIHSGVQCTW